MKNLIEEVKSQMDLLCNPVRSTLGVFGSTVLIKEHDTYITKDGVSVARAIKKKYDKPIINIVEEVSERTVEKAGDGTTSSLVFAHALYNYISEHKIANKELVRKYLNQFANQSKEYIDKVKNKEFKPYDVAMISTNGDESISKLVDEVYSKIGNEGTVNIKKSDTDADFIINSIGMKWKVGYISSVFINNASKNTCEFNNVKVVIFNDKIKYITDNMISLLEKNKHNPILLIVNDIEMSALQVFAKNKLQGLDICIIKIPGHSKYKTDNIEDLRSFIGSNDYLDKVIISKNETIFIQATGNEKQIEERTNLLKHRLTLSDENINDLKDRITNINSAYCDLYIGGNSDVEIKERIDRAEDAVCAVKSAYNGVVIGGGNMYKRIVNNKILYYTGHCNEELLAKSCFEKALLSIQEQLLANYNGIYNYKYGDIQLAENPIIFTDGVVTHLETYDNLNHKVIEPADVIKLVIENGVSVVGTLMSISDIIENEPKDNFGLI